MTEKNTEKIRPFLGRIPRPNAVQEMIRESEREIEYLRVMLKASREMENIESTPKPEVSPKPKRQEGWMQPDGECSNVPSGHPSEIHVREVLPGDPTPETIEKAIRLINDWVKNSESKGCRMVQLRHDALEALAAKLRGETD